MGLCCISCRLRCRQLADIQAVPRPPSRQRRKTDYMYRCKPTPPNHGRIDERVWRASNADSKKQSWPCCLPPFPHTGRHYPASQRGGRPTPAPTRPVARHAQPHCSSRSSHLFASSMLLSRRSARSLRCVLYDCAKQWSFRRERRETTWYFQELMLSNSGEYHPAPLWSCCNSGDVYKYRDLLILVRQ